jgi:sporulation protein YlmC with PRC-barrel domain
MGILSPKVRTALLAAALPAFAAAGAPSDWTDRTNADDWRLTKILRGEVETAEGREVGDVHDVLIGPEGRIDSVIVERPAGSDGVGARYARVLVDRLSFEPDEAVVRLEGGRDETADWEVAERPPGPPPGHHSAHRLVGLPVNLDGAAPWGEIDELLVARNTHDVTAFVIEPNEDRADFSVPWKAAVLELEEHLLVLPFTEDEIGSLEESPWGEVLR